MKKYIQLVRPCDDDSPDHYGDVAMMRRLLNRSDYDAREGDIQWAWRRYSDETSAAGWLDPCDLPDFVVRDAIVERLTPLEDD